MEVSQLESSFEEMYCKKATAAYFAPGRVNLIGEHTDYNGGYVFPCALSFGTYLLLRANEDGVLRFRSLNMDEVAEVGIGEELKPLPGKHWANYPLGSIAQLQKRGKRLDKGYDMLFWGDVPAGAGLSSSAAIEVVTVFAMAEQLGMEVSRTEVAKMAQMAEHEFAGVNCGIMDQFASAQGKKDMAIYLDCNTLAYELVPVKLEGIKVVISNTHSPHKLDSGAYNSRVRECQEAVRQLRKERADLQNLAEVKKEEFEQWAEKISDETVRRRARHVVGEVARTREAVESLQRGDIEQFGRLMNQSHVSLRDDYEVTGPELDALAEAAWEVDGVLGSRMTGGGFGGCTVSLVREEAIERFIAEVGSAYTKKTGLKADFYIAAIGDGVRKVL